jgi:quercetin dioxygenase-like cupin family protein
MNAPSDAQRLREPPRERFAGRSHHISLTESLAKLRSEDHPARDGHRQITLHHEAPVTQVLFSFDAGGRIEQHSAPGLVTIHVLEGRLKVLADHVDNDLGAGDVLVLAPGLPHDVRSADGAAMLLTVHLSRKDD